MKLKDLIYAIGLAGALILAANACDNYAGQYDVKYTGKSVAVVEKKSIFGQNKCRVKAVESIVFSSIDGKMLSPEEAKFYINGDLYSDGDVIRCDSAGEYSGQILPRTLEKKVNNSYVEVQD